MSWLGNAFRTMGLGRTLRLVTAVVALAAVVTSTIVITCQGGARRYLPSADLIGWATTHAHDKAADALLEEIELVRVSRDGTIDRQGGEPLATLRFRAPSLGRDRCELRVEVRGWEYTTLVTRRPFDADLGLGCRAPVIRPPTCDARTIWERAVHDGAAATGAATLTYRPRTDALTTPDADQPIAGRWTYEHGPFTRVYDDDCAAAARR